MCDKVKNTTKRYSYVLIFLCWLAYTSSYFGKLSYSANINQIEDFFNVSHGQSGLVGTLLFVSYGVFQIINGFLVKRYNIRFVVAMGLFSSGVINLLVGISTNFVVVTVLWFFNGIALSFLWTAVIRVLAETLTKEYMAKSSVVIGTTVPMGTLVVYGLSALFVELGVFRAIFYFSGIAMPVIAIIWFVFLPKITSKIPKDAEVETKAEMLKVSKAEIKGVYLSVFCFFAIAVCVNLIKDGLNTWAPVIFKNEYGISGSLSIILTLALPCIAVFGNLFAVTLHKKIPDFVTQVAIMFVLSGGLVGVVLLALDFKILFLTIICFVLIFLMISSCNSVVTSVFPLFMKARINSGKIAGLTNGFCYLGSALSSYVLGAIAENFGWSIVFYVILGVCAFVFIIWMIYLLIKAKIKKQY
ncbi:MAG: MFS transporter [Clostridia bacterium]|nr:MFS transporter [Clostridia bacterium]